MFFFLLILNRCKKRFEKTLTNLSKSRLASLVISPHSQCRARLEALARPLSRHGVDHSIGKRVLIARG